MAEAAVAHPALGRRVPHRGIGVTKILECIYSTTEMKQPAVIASQSGEPTMGLREIVSASGHDIVDTVVTDRSEDNQYYLAPSTIDQVEACCPVSGTATPSLVVDGTVHPGQMVDLQTRLPAVTVHDRRDAVLKRLGETNPTAATRFDLRRSWIACRAAARAQRDGAASAPSGTSGRLADHRQRCQQLRTKLDGQQQDDRRNIENAYTGVDGYVVLLGRGTASTTALWTGLTGAEASEAAGRPSQATTDMATVGPHTVAVTDTPSVIAPQGLPEWFTDGVPSVDAALERADLVLCVGPGADGLVTAVSERFDGDHRGIDGSTPDAARAQIADALDTAEYVLRLPYDDDAQALLSRLHETAAIADVTYQAEIVVRLKISRSVADTLTGRVEQVGGEATPIDPST